MELIFPKNPTTSWIIRTKNEEKWLGEVLRGLFVQSRLDFEVVIVDSGSTDKTLEIIKSYPIRKVINIPSSDFNYSYAINLGGKEAWGKYIGILSGHSLPVSRTWYQDVMINFSNPKVAAVTGYYHALPDSSVNEKLRDLYFDVRELKKEHKSKYMTNTNAIIRKDLWREYYFDENLEECEDYDWACEMLARGYDIIKDPVFNVYHSHGGFGRPTYDERVIKWQKTLALIDAKKRPSKSHSNIKYKIEKLGE
ncbi:glycosyltransferase [Candidatus Parcubacteria bacterium]|nr:MAG: glycosyltransferase [Candidatus Parcubacteria bacterium]